MLVGDLRVEELRDEVLRRHVRVARLVDQTRPRDPDRLPPLYDVTLPAMSLSLSAFFDGVRPVSEQVE